MRKHQHAVIDVGNCSVTPLQFLQAAFTDTSMRSCCSAPSPDVMAPHTLGAVVPGPPFSMAAVIATTSASICRTCGHKHMQEELDQHQRHRGLMLFQ